MEIDIIYNEDCLGGMKKRLPDKSIDLTITSPPYDDLRAYGGYEFKFEPIAKELYRVTKDGGVIVWMVGDATIKGNETGTSFRQALYFKKIGFNLHDTMIYRKNNYIPLSHNRYEPEFEYMFVFSKGKPNVFNPIMINCLNAGKVIKRSRKINDKGMGLRQEQYALKTKKYKQRGNIWSYKTGGAKTANHPAQFPDKLAQDHLLSWSNENDIILDPMFGSGTTLKMARKHQRHYIGFEINPEYCEIAKKRLAEVQLDLIR